MSFRSDVLNNESNEVLYKFTPKYSIKDYMELYKITNRNVYILIRVCAVIFFITQIIKNDFEYKSIPEILIIFLVNIIIFIFLYNLPNIMACRMKKVYITPEEHTIILYFYK